VSASRKGAGEGANRDRWSSTACYVTEASEQQSSSALYQRCWIRKRVSDLQTEGKSAVLSKFSLIFNNFLIILFHNSFLVIPAVLHTTVIKLTVQWLTADRNCRTFELTTHDCSEKINCRVIFPQKRELDGLAYGCFAALSRQSLILFVVQQRIDRQNS
jgi:hypothetical protein